MQEFERSKIKDQKKSVDRIEGQAERMRTGIGDGDLPNQIAVRFNYVQYRITTDGTGRIEAETCHVDIVVRTDGQSLYAARDTCGHIWQDCQHIDITPVPCVQGRCRLDAKQSDGRPEFFHDTLPNLNVVVPIPSGRNSKVCDNSSCR